MPSTRISTSSDNLGEDYASLNLHETYSPQLSGASTPTILPRPDAADDEEEHEELMELQENTFNRGSEGRGGWKMLGDEQGPSFQPLDRQEIAWMCLSTILVSVLSGFSLGLKSGIGSDLRYAHFLGARLDV
jgi:hypothetical protein